MAGLDGEILIIGASVSKPHTSDSNGGFSLSIYMYICIVRHTSFRIFLTL